MEKNISMEELLKNYQEVCEEQIKNENLKYFSLDLQSVIEFYKGTNITKCYVGEQRKWDAGHLPYTIEKALPAINDGEQIAYFDNNSCQIISKDKKVTMDIYAVNHPRMDGRRATSIEVTQVTPDGIFHMYFKPSDKNVRLYYCLNESLLPLASRNEWTIEEYKYNFLHNNYRSNGKIIGLREIYSAYMTNFDIEYSDIPIVANMLFRTDISGICKYASDYQRSRNNPIDRPYLSAKEYFKLTDHDRKFFELTSEEKELIKKVQVSLEDKVLYYYEERENNDKISTNSSEKRNKIIEQLILLKDAGVELTQEQYIMINLYDKLNSEKFQEYKNNSQNRKERQEELRNKIASDNTRKENWHNSPENPTNKRIENIKHLKKQIQVLEELSKVDASLLSAEQRELLKNGKIYLEMIETTQSLEHEVDTGMNPEIRSWYQNYYSNEECKSRK